MAKKNELKKITNPKIQDWLSLNGYNPVYVWKEEYYYKRMPLLDDLLEQYDIRYKYIKNTY